MSAAPSVSPTPLSLSGFNGKPSLTRSSALENFSTLVTGGDQPNEIFHSVNGEGLTFFTDIPASCLPPHDAPAGTKGPEVMLGIDEAGRGSALGPMTYGAAFWPISMKEEMDAKGFDDSKALTHKTRRALLTKMEKTEDLGYLVRTLQVGNAGRCRVRCCDEHQAAIETRRSELAAQNGCCSDRLLLRTAVAQNGCCSDRLLLSPLPPLFSHVYAPA